MGQLLNYFLHIDYYVIDFIAHYGLWIYPALFLIIFAETGFIITPFLPGDSLLFTVGSFSAQPDTGLEVLIVLCLLTMAAMLGNQVNYSVGRFLGPSIFVTRATWFLNTNHLDKTHQFYEKHGGKTIIMARFIPIVRSFAPFVAGASAMSSRHFTTYNVVSALLWVGSLVGLGYFFGAIPLIKNHFSLVIYLIILISLMPPLIGFVRAKLKMSAA